MKFCNLFLTFLAGKKKVFFEQEGLPFLEQTRSSLRDSSEGLALCQMSISGNFHRG